MCTVKEYTDRFNWAEGLKFLFPAFGSCGISWVLSQKAVQWLPPAIPEIEAQQDNQRPFTATVNESSLDDMRSCPKKKFPEPTLQLTTV